MTHALTRRDLLQGAFALVGTGAAGAREADSSPRHAPSKGVYLSYYGVGDRTIQGRVFGLLDRTELNTIVIDVKGDRGFIPYESRAPLARSAGAMGPVRVPDFDALLAGLKAKGIHTVARVVVFKDDVLARYRPEWAVADMTTGSPWLDNERLAWIDPFHEEAWAYPIAVAQEAALKGFDEIQFDYLRFPSEGRLGAARYARASTQQSRVQAIGRFLRQARLALAPVGAALAIDVFGYTAFNPDDTGIGQRIEELAPLVDVLCPMAYPSAYHVGIPGFRNPVAHPYEVVFETVQRIRGRSAQAPVQVRPWIQDFGDYAFDRRPFGVPEIRAQMRGALDGGASGWMLWNPGNHYTAGALDSRNGRD
ncbi:MAG TPA: putative glycoside hydrolase [Methylomirabilota bacterium]|nr:putative glycoside hydrolase [Methylomirabilota bacterium]